MPSIFSRLKGKDGLTKSKSKKGVFDSIDSQPQKPRWEDAYARKTVEADEIQELISRCTDELKARGMRLARPPWCQSPAPFAIPPPPHAGSRDCFHG